MNDNEKVRKYLVERGYMDWGANNHKQAHLFQDFEKRINLWRYDWTDKPSEFEAETRGPISEGNPDADWFQFKLYSFTHADILTRLPEIEDRLLRMVRAARGEA
jgi:hypothetical protein